MYQWCYKFEWYFEHGRAFWYWHQYCDRSYSIQFWLVVCFLGQIRVFTMTRFLASFNQQNLAKPHHSMFGWLESLSLMINSKGSTNMCCYKSLCCYYCRIILLYHTSPQVKMLESDWLTARESSLCHPPPY